MKQIPILQTTVFNFVNYRFWIHFANYLILAKELYAHFLIIEKLMIHALLTVLYLQMQWIGELCFLLSFQKKMTMENTQFAKPQELNLQT